MRSRKDCFNSSVTCAVGRGQESDGVHAFYLSLWFFFLIMYKIRGLDQIIFKSHGLKMLLINRICSKKIKQRRRGGYGQLWSCSFRQVTPLSE